MDQETVETIIFNEALCFAKSKHKMKKECTLNDIQRFKNRLREKGIEDQDEMIETIMRGTSREHSAKQ